MGWVLSADGAWWVLLDSRGGQVWQVAAAYVERRGAGAVNAKGAGLGRGWPELIPGRPYIQCLLVGGPLDGAHRFLDPRVHEEPPDVLAVEREQPLPGMPPGPGPDAAVMVRPVSYRQAGSRFRDGVWLYVWEPHGGGGRDVV